MKKKDIAIIIIFNYFTSSEINIQGDSE